MFATDILLLVFGIVLLMPWPVESTVLLRRVRMAILALLGITLVAHFALDHSRWQMVPAYVLVLAATVATIWRFRRTSKPRRRWLRISATIAAALFAAIAIIVPAAFPVYDIPAPSGEYRVGVRDIDLVDQDRPDPFDTRSGESRKLAVRVWYPAPADVEGETQPVASDAVAGALSDVLSGRRGTASFLLDHLSMIRGNAILDADLEERPGGYPALLFNHGFSGYVGQNTAMMEDLASHGYVVVSIGHSGDAAAVEFSDGRIYPFKRDGVLDVGNHPEVPELTRAMAEETDPARYHAVVARIIELTDPADQAARLWAGDIRFVMDELTATGLGFPDGQIDLNRIGVFGHSLGGAASAQACLEDTRCGAVINLDGMQYGDLTRRDLNVPTLMFYAEHENPGILFNDIMYRANPGDVGDTPLRFLIHRNTRHLDGSELALLLSPVFKSLLPENPVMGNLPGEEIISIHSDIVRAFFDEQLKGNAGALDESVSRHADVESWDILPIEDFAERRETE